MIGRTNTGGSGGGGGLNFRVLGGTSAPSNPKENDIWVNTDTEITAWAFKNDIPVIGEVTTKIATENSYLNSDGNLISSENYSVTDYTVIPKNTSHILVRHSKGGSTGFCHEFSNANKEKISMVERAAGDVTYKVPENAVYVRLSVRISPGYEDPLTFIPYTEEYNGMVWISTGTSSAVAFNALKKNSIEVYPTVVKQCVSGEWVAVEAKIYQNGKWVAFKTNILLGMSFNKTYNHGNKVSFHSPTADEPYLEVSTTYESSSAQGKLIVCTDKTYDLTGVNTIEIVVENWTIGNTSYPAKIGVCSAVPTALGSTIHPSVTISKSISAPTEPLLVDVSEVSGHHYIAVKSEGSTTEPKTTGGTISGIYLV